MVQCLPAMGFSAATADVNDYDNFIKVVSEADEKLGKLDVLANNTGLGLAISINIITQNSRRG